MLTMSFYFALWKQISNFKFKAVILSTNQDCESGVLPQDAPDLTLIFHFI